MHAVVVEVDTSGADRDQAAERLRGEIVPRISGLPGFQSGTWCVHPTERRGLALIVFDSEESARAASDMVSVGSNPQPGVTVERSEVREVVAQA